jgi:putative ABC transport system substrate-binding protein
MRRTAIGVLGLILVFGPALAQSEKIHRLGVLLQNSRAREVIQIVLVPELEKHGFTEGKNLIIDVTAGASEQLPLLAKELVARDPSAVIAAGGRALSAATAATATIPIVTFGANPVELGYAQSLSHPAGNVTGLVILLRELDAKRLELLREAVPNARRVAALVNPHYPGATANRRQMTELATKFDTELLVFEATGADDYRTAFDRITASGVKALVIVADPQFNSDAAVLARLALEAGVATVCQWREMAEQGCLLSYGPSYADMWRRTARFISSVLKGASAGDIPIEQPMAFEMVVNAKTAAALGIRIPQALLARADEVIE